MGSDYEKKLAEAYKRLNELSIAMEKCFRENPGVDSKGDEKNEKLTTLKNNFGGKSDEELEAEVKREIAQEKQKRLEEQRKKEEQERIENERRMQEQKKREEQKREEQRKKEEQERKAAIRRRLELEELYEQHGGKKTMSVKCRK